MGFQRVARGRFLAGIGEEYGPRRRTKDKQARRTLWTVLRAVGAPDTPMYFDFAQGSRTSTAADVFGEILHRIHAGFSVGRSKNRAIFKLKVKSKNHHKNIYFYWQRWFNDHLLLHILYADGHLNLVIFYSYLENNYKIVYFAFSGEIRADIE